MSGGLTQQQMDEILIQRLFGYHPSIELAGVSIALFSLCMIIHTYLAWKHSARYMYIIGVTGAAEVLGYIFRIIVANHPSINSYIVMELCLLVSPIALAVINYIVVGKLLAQAGEKVGPFKPQHIARFFLGSDIFSFIIQSGGGGMLASGNSSFMDIGRNTILFGLTIQLLFFASFTWITIIIQNKSKFGLKNDSSLKPVFHGLYITIILLFIRNIYRVVEFGTGRGGYISTHELFFGFFESLPIFLAFIFYGIFHFGRLLPSKSFGEMTQV